MGLLKITKDLFAVNDTLPEPPENQDTAVTRRKEITYQEYGYHQASLLAGTIAGLRVCLQKIYFDFKEQVKNDQEKQEELKRPLRVKVEEYRGDIERWTNRIRKIREEDLPEMRRRTDILKEEKRHLRQHPQEIVADLTGKPSFYVGCFILASLTLYLFVFYSSASYSTFFKEFTLTNVGVVKSIFDAKALSQSLKDGVTELMLIITIPSVFLGLGYLIHKLQEEQNMSKYFKIGLLISVTFIFDAILAYEITEKIYEIVRKGSIDDMPEYSILLAMRAINFWLIIFAGFVVYLIWGFVFDFVLAAHAKMDKVRVALKEKDRQIEDVNKQTVEMNTEIDKMNHHIDDAKTQIKKLQESLAGFIIPGEFETSLYSFMAGWLSWMSGAGKSADELHTAETVVVEYVNTISANTPKIQDQ
ncbi:coiled-coil domain-containing protein [Chitinophaga rhizophila]|uniref:Uncharacterized protein n=1 Tax=Chitinophaga rhizophila TaxID=2866212 RepID=A0ABS7G9N0_9BACT|nr:hypothetical protein [Chitinophaga rhizophila]MBW8684349.1 hypothetical protein [Chitinophaga rhizophila]